MTKVEVRTDHIIVLTDREYLNLLAWLEDLLGAPGEPEEKKLLAKLIEKIEVLE